MTTCHSPASCPSERSSPVPAYDPRQRTAFAVIAAALWIAISHATGAPIPFSLGGGILTGVIVFIIGYGLRRLIFDRRRLSPVLGQPPQRR
jgi:hypothetical protein